MNVDRITRNWFKFSVSTFGKEDKEYSLPCSSCLDKNVFSWQKFADNCTANLLRNRQLDNYHGKKVTRHLTPN